MIHIIYLLYFIILVVLSRIDMRERIVPDRYIVLIAFFGLLATVFTSELPFLCRVWGLFAVSFPLLIISVVTNGGIGGGDIKLFAVSGFLFGWQVILLSALISCLLAAITSLILQHTKRNKEKTELPFVPFITAGMTAVFLLSYLIN